MAQQALHDQKNRMVEVNRIQLLATLVANKEKHIKDFHEAVEGYKESAMQKLKDGHETAKQNIEKNLARGIATIESFDSTKVKDAPNYIVFTDQIIVKLPVPQNYSDEYDAAIAVAEWDVRETLELTNAEFQCFVRDIWGWSEDFTKVSTMYKQLSKR